MTAYGIPSLIVSLIVGKPETLIITEPEENESFYIIKKITGILYVLIILDSSSFKSLSIFIKFSTPLNFLTDDGARVKDHKFELNVKHETTYNKGKGTMQTICTSPEKNVLECNSDEEEKEWKITDRLEFEPLGIINTKTFHTKNIVTKKYYEVGYCCSQTYEKLYIFN